jgi:hypothetical protein
VGYALFLAQCGERHPAAKTLQGDLGGLVEIVDDWDGNRHVISLIKERYRRAQEYHARHYAKKE